MSFLDFQFNSTEERKTALKDLHTALAAAQAAQVTAQPATTTIIPKPRGTSGRGSFNLANEMGIDTETCRQIQVRVTFILLPGYSLCPQGFIRSLVNLSALDKSKVWKNQPGDEVHKIFTVVGSLASSHYNSLS